MTVYIEGPSGLLIDWKTLQDMIAQTVVVKTTSSIGVSVQKAGDRQAAMEDQVVGKHGPSIGKWNPEKGNRMIQEF